VSSHYYRELYQVLQSLSQGTKSVDEYFKNMEIVMIQASVQEDREGTMNMFMNDLNHDITYIVEMHNYMELEEMVDIVV